LCPDLTPAGDDIDEALAAEVNGHELVRVMKLTRGILNVCAHVAYNL